MTRTHKADEDRVIWYKGISVKPVIVKLEVVPMQNMNVAILVYFAGGKVSNAPFALRALISILGRNFV